ncbi:MAG: cytochrome c3 family protein, partial [Desulfitobacteriaceae bacterium]
MTYNRKKYLITIMFFFVFLITFFSLIQQAESNPHGNYTDNTDACALCHATHTATGIKLMRMPTDKLLCYTCHDSTGSIYNTRAAFGESVAGSSTLVSHHQVPEGNLKCVDCHNP